MEQRHKTVELVTLNASTKEKGSSMTEEDKLDQEDQRIKAVELDKLDEISEGNSLIMPGDWPRRIKQTIVNLSKRSGQ